VIMPKLTKVAESRGAMPQEPPANLK